MNSISTKIKVAALVGLATLVSIALYVKADKMAEDASLDSSYSVYAGATTNLNAVMKAQPRANEYTSSEYMSKMAPDASQASEYLALYEYDSDQDNSGAYRRRTAPTMHQSEIKDGDPVPVRSVRQNKTTHWNDDSEFTYGIRSAVVQSDTLKEEEQAEDPRLHIETNAKRRIVSADGYSRDYSRVVRNAEMNDDAYQVREDMPYERRAVNEGYAIARAPQSNTPTNDDAYARRKAPMGTNSAPVLDGAGSTKYAETSPSYQGYAVKTVAPKQTASLSQYDNAKDNDKAYGGYAVRSSNQGGTSSTTAGAPIDGYARRKAPTMGTNTAPVKDYYANNTPQETHGGYAVKTPGKNQAAAPKVTREYAQSSSQGTYGGYAVRSGNQDANSKPASRNLNASVDGYARRKAPSMGGSTNIAQYENASKNDYAYKSSPSTNNDDNYGGYAVKTPGKQSTPSPRREYAQSSSNDSYGGYAVKTPGKNNRTIREVASTTPTRRQTASVRGGVPASTGLKMYGSRGERLATSTSQLNRTVIVMPKRGRSIQGTVVQDDPGRNIIVQSTTGVQSTYRYGEIDAVVNL